MNKELNNYMIPDLANLVMSYAVELPKLPYLHDLHDIYFIIPSLHNYHKLYFVRPCNIMCGIYLNRFKYRRDNQLSFRFLGN